MHAALIMIGFVMLAVSETSAANAGIAVAVNLAGLAVLAIGVARAVKSPQREY